MRGGRSRRRGRTPAAGCARVRVAGGRSPRSRPTAPPASVPAPSGSRNRQASIVPARAARTPCRDPGRRRGRRGPRTRPPVLMFTSSALPWRPGPRTASAHRPTKGTRPCRRRSAGGSGAEGMLHSRVFSGGLWSAPAASPGLLAFGQQLIDNGNFHLEAPWPGSPTPVLPDGPAVQPAAHAGDAAVVVRACWGSPWYAGRAARALTSRRNRHERPVAADLVVQELGLDAGYAEPRHPARVRAPEAAGAASAARNDGCRADITLTAAGRRAVAALEDRSRAKRRRSSRRGQDAGGTGEAAALLHARADRRAAGSAGSSSTPVLRPSPSRRPGLGSRTATASSTADRWRPPLTSRFAGDGGRHRGRLREGRRRQARVKAWMAERDGDRSWAASRSCGGPGTSGSCGRRAGRAVRAGLWASDGGWSRSASASRTPGRVPAHDALHARHAGGRATPLSRGGLPRDAPDARPRLRAQRVTAETWDPTCVRRRPLRHQHAGRAPARRVTRSRSRWYSSSGITQLPAERPVILL